MNPAFRHLGQPLLGLLLLLGLGCAQTETRVRRSNVMEFLYPTDKQQPAPPDPAGARLKLPLKVGIVFIPAAERWRGESGIPPAREKALLDLVRKPFLGKPWVSSVQVIPSNYLTTKGGFTNLQQIGRMFDVDVMALVSVDQVQYTNPKWYSFLYISVVGAYTLHGDANDTQTLIDAAVFDLSSRTFILRAPGQSLVKGSSNPVDRDEQMRKQSNQSLELAMADLAKNLDAEVASFKEEVARGERPNVDVVDKQGQSLRQTGGRNWGGSFTWLEAVAGLALVGYGLRRRS